MGQKRFPPWKNHIFATDWVREVKQSKLSGYFRAAAERSKEREIGIAENHVVEEPAHNRTYLLFMTSYYLGFKFIEVVFSFQKQFLIVNGDK